MLVRIYSLPAVTPPVHVQDLYLGSTLMMDPLCLLDYPEVEDAADVLIVVQGQMGVNAKK